MTSHDDISSDLTDDDLGALLTTSLDEAANGVARSGPPTFSWQRPAPVAVAGGRRTTRRAVYAGTGLAAAVAAALVAGLVISGNGSAPPRPVAAPSHTTQAHHGPHVATHQQDGSATTLLLVAARTTLRQGAVPLTDGQYRYIRTVGPAPTIQTATPAGSQQRPHVQTPPPGAYTLDELWVPKDETDVWMRRQSVHGEDIGAPLVWKGRCDDLYADTQDGPKGPACTRPGSFEDPTPAFVAGLPRDPDALYAQLHAYAEQNLNPEKDHDVDSVMFRTVNDLLGDGVVTNDLTSTLYSVLSRIPGITVEQDVPNANGVTGTGFQLSTTFGTGADATPDTMTVIVDLSSGAYLGYHEVGPGIDYLDAVSVGVSDRLGVTGH